MDRPIDSIHNRIRKALSITNMKPIDLATKTGITKASISHYMSGRYEPKQDRIYLMSQAFGCDPAWLIGYDVPFEAPKAMPQPNLTDEQLADICEKWTTLTPEKKAMIANMVNLLSE